MVVPCISLSWSPPVVELWRAFLAFGVAFLMYELTRQRRNGK